MAKDKLTDYDSTAANNLDVGGISVAEGMLPSGVNNAIREQMSHLADFAAGTSGVDVLKLQDDTDTNSIKLQAPSSVTTTTTFTLPDGDGESGQTMITDGAGTLSWAAPYGSRNLIINGAMQVAQRGTSFSFAHDGTTSAYTLDRFYCITGNSDEWDCTVTQDSDAPSGFSSCLKVTTGTAETSVGADEYYYLQHRIEAQNLQHLDFGSSTAKKLTLSFWIKSSITGTYAVMFYRQDSTRTINATYTIDSANTWEYKTITIDGDTTGAIANDNGQGISIYWGFASGTDYNSTVSSSWAAYAGTNLLGGQAANGVVTTAGATFQLTGVQLEVGEQATPFEHRSYGDELLRCQRYFHRIGGSTGSGLYDAVGTGAVISTTQGFVNVPLKVQMRAKPSVTFTGTLTMHEGSTAPDLDNSNFDNYMDKNGGLLGPVKSGGTNLTTGNGLVLYCQNSADSADFDAEL